MKSFNRLTASNIHFPSWAVVVIVVSTIAEKKEKEKGDLKGQVDEEMKKRKEAEKKTKADTKKATKAD